MSHGPCPITSPAPPPGHVRQAARPPAAHSLTRANGSVARGRAPAAPATPARGYPASQPPAQMPSPARASRNSPAPGPAPCTKRLIGDGIAAAPTPGAGAVDHVTARRLAICLAARPQSKRSFRPTAWVPLRPQPAAVSQGAEDPAAQSTPASGTYADQAPARPAGWHTASPRGHRPRPRSVGRTSDAAACEPDRTRADTLSWPTLTTRARHRGPGHPEPAWPETAGPPDSPPWPAHGPRNRTGHTSSWTRPRLNRRDVRPQSGPCRRAGGPRSAPGVERSGSQPCPEGLLRPHRRPTLQAIRRPRDTGCAGPACAPSSRPCRHRDPTADNTA